MAGRAGHDPGWISTKTDCMPGGLVAHTERVSVLKVVAGAVADKGMWHCCLKSRLTL
jgi:hypothetical protein